MIFVVENLRTETGTFPASSRSTRRRRENTTHICQNGISKSFVFRRATCIFISVFFFRTPANHRCYGTLSGGMVQPKMLINVIPIDPHIDSCVQCSHHTIISCCSSKTTQKERKKINDFLIGFCSQMDLSYVPIVCRFLLHCLQRQVIQLFDKNNQDCGLHQRV